MHVCVTVAVYFTSLSGLWSVLPFCFVFSFCICIYTSTFYIYLCFLPFFREAFILGTFSKNNHLWFWNWIKTCFFYLHRYFIVSMHFTRIQWQSFLNFESYVCCDKTVFVCCRALSTKLIIKQILFYQKLSGKLITYYQYIISIIEKSVSLYKCFQYIPTGFSAVLGSLSLSARCAWSSSLEDVIAFNISSVREFKIAKSRSTDFCDFAIHQRRVSAITLDYFYGIKLLKDFSYVSLNSSTYSWTFLPEYKFDQSKLAAKQLIKSVSDLL